MGEKIKIFAFTDFHASKSVLEHLKKSASSCDIAVCCGDFTIFGNAISTILKELNFFPVPIVLTHGNHESYSEVQKICRKLKNIYFIHEKSVVLKNIEFFGYGGGGFSLRDPRFVNLSKKFSEKAKTNRKNHIFNVLVTHGPPFGTALDDLYNKNYCGNKDYSIFFEKNPIDLFLCGHIHENFGKIDYIDKRPIINPGPKGMMIEVEFP